jgi:hypothetical protein
MDNEKTVPLNTLPPTMEALIHELDMVSRKLTILGQHNSAARVHTALVILGNALKATNVKLAKPTPAVAS